MLHSPMEVKRRDAQNNSRKRPAVARFPVRCTFPQLTKYFNDMRQVTLKVMNDDRNGESAAADGAPCIPVPRLARRLRWIVPGKSVGMRARPRDKESLTGTRATTDEKEGQRKG